MGQEPDEEPDQDTRGERLVSSREGILAAIRANKPAPRPLPDVPFFDEGADSATLEERFLSAFRFMGGTVLPPSPDDPLASVHAKTAGAAIVVSRVPEVAGTLDLKPDMQPASLADVDVAIVRAAFGVAETGSIALTEAELGINTLAYLAQHLIVLLDPADIVINIHHAYQRSEFQSARYTVFHTGPVGDGGYRGRADPRRAGRALAVSILLLTRS